MNLILKLGMFAVVLGSMPLSGAILNFQSVDGVKDSTGNYVGPYAGQLDGVSYKLECDDYDHNINIPDTETVNVSKLTDLSLTRFGSKSGATALYEQVFYLSSYLIGASNTQRANVQDAMWSYFAADAPSQANAAVQGWISQAQMNYGGKDYSSFRILTEANSVARPTAQFDGRQELFISLTSVPVDLTSAPEPATWALLLAGVGGIAVMRMRSKRNGATESL